MMRDLEIQHLELSIKTWLKRMDELFYSINDVENDLSDADFTHKEIVSEMTNEFVFLDERVRRACSLYFELKGGVAYAENFVTDVNKLLSSPTKIERAPFKSIYGDTESFITKLYRNFLYPFRAFGGGDEYLLTGLDYLQSILKNTTRIVTDKGIPPTQESDVYNSVKVVIECTFSKESVLLLDGNHPFYAEAKCYKPDILISTLNCAIEYKFAPTVQALIRNIDEILADVHGYSNHPIYKSFYAVFYVKTGITTEEKFKQIWDGKNFPNNWHPIFVEGPIAAKPAKIKK